MQGLARLWGMHFRRKTESSATASGTTWHLHWQAAIGQTFLPHPTMADRIRGRLIAAHRLRERVLLDYTILPTEIHVIARLSGVDTPGAVANAIGSVVARWVREAGRIRSHVMGGPFRSYLLETDDAVRQESRMLAWRPAFLRLSRGPALYPNGALRTALGMRPAQGFDVRPLLQLFGDSPLNARAALRSWVSQRPTDLDWHAWELARGLTLAPRHGGSQPGGFHELRTGEVASLVAVAGDGGVEAALGLLVHWVCARMGAAGALDLHRGRDGAAARGRAVVARIAVAHGLCSAAFVARYFGKAPATLCEQMAASRMRKAETLLVLTPMTSILEELGQMEKATGRAGAEH